MYHKSDFGNTIPILRKIKEKMNKWDYIKLKSFWRLKRYLSKEDIQIAHRHMKTSLIIWGMQIKITLRSHLTFVRMIHIKRMKLTKYWQGCCEKGIFIHCWWGMRAHTIPVVWRVLKKKTEIPFHPALLLLGIYPNNVKNLIWDNLSTHTIHIVAQFTNHGANSSVPQQGNG